MTPATRALVAEGLACRRGERAIFTDVGFTVHPGEALVVTGRNGAGKSSLIAILAGLLRPEAGHIIYGGAPDDRLADHVALVGHRDGLKAMLTAAENLAFARRLLGASDVSVEEGLAAVGLAHAAALPVAYLSAGQRKRVALARLIVCPPPVWQLDEPTSALDAASQEVLADLLARHLAAGGIVVAATHGPLGLDTVQELRLSGAAMSAAMPGAAPVAGFDERWW